jgi:hypothetical protein
MARQDRHGAGGREYWHWTPGWQRRAGLSRCCPVVEIVPVAALGAWTRCGSDDYVTNPIQYPEGDEDQWRCPGYQPRCVEKMSSVGPTSVRYWKKWPGLGTRNGSTIHQACDHPAGLSVQEKR